MNNEKHKKLLQQKALSFSAKELELFPKSFRLQKIKNVTDFGNKIFTIHDFEVAMLS